MKLPDYFIPLIAFVRSLEPGSVSAEPQDIANDIDSLITQAQNLALKNGLAIERFQEGLFPVLAWADEHIASKHLWSTEHAWQRFLLQRRYFRTALAGREFFDRLSQLDARAHDIREVYLMCLCLGFLGRYSITPNSAELTSLRMEQYQLIRAANKGTGTDDAVLFPKAYDAVPIQSSGINRVIPARKRFSTARILLFVLPPLILLMVALGLHAELTESVELFREKFKL